MRNSSLVEWSGTDNVARLKHRTEAVECFFWKERALVGERCAQQRSQTARTGGADGSANAGTSSEKRVRNVFAVNLRFPGQR